MKTKVSIVQDSPVFFDIDATIDKIDKIVCEHAKNESQLFVFPESFIPGYPRGFSFGAVVGRRTQEGRALYKKYHENSLDIDSPQMARLEKIAKDNAVYLVIGVTEKMSNNGSLYCSMLYISPKNGLLGVHRKIKPTGTERLIWAESDGSSLVTFDTPIGKLGGLICWENYMPLARMAMYQKGVELYIAPTADAREEWISTMQHIALEGRCFVIACNQYFTKNMYPEDYQSFVAEEKDEMCNGGSVIVSPLGKIIAGPLIGSAGVLTAELDLDEIIESKLDFDANGHYNRPDIFDFNVDNQPEIKVDK